MPNPRDILNKLKWHEHYTLTYAEITYTHRGAPHNTRTINGSEIIDLSTSFMITTSASIPYHRILTIHYNGKPVFKRHTAHNK